MAQGNGRATGLSPHGHRRLETDYSEGDIILRNAKHVELTANGHKMYDQVVSMLAMHDRMLQSMKWHDSDAIYLWGTPGGSLPASARHVRAVGTGA